MSKEKQFGTAKKMVGIKAGIAAINMGQYFESRGIDLSHLADNQGEK